MQRLLINRITLRFELKKPVFMILRSTDDFTLSSNKVQWIEDKLQLPTQDEFIDWVQERDLEDDAQLATEFKETAPEEHDGSIFVVKLTDSNCQPFKRELLKQELAQHLQSKGFFINPSKFPMDFSAYQKTGEFDNEYDQYRKIDFRWNHKREELSFNFGSERSLITNTDKNLEGDTLVFNTENLLVYKSPVPITGKTICPREVSVQRTGAPIKFNYKDRYEKLKLFAAEHLYDFESSYFSLDKTGLKNVNPDDFYNVFSQQNLMTFSHDKTAVNAVIGMREYGPLKKAENSEKKRLLFIYDSKDAANNLYLYLKNGHKHFPGLLSYVGIPVALAEANESKGLPYTDVTRLPEQLNEFLGKHYPNSLYPDTLAIVIGPFKRFEADEEESDSYYKIKKTLLEKGIASQFVSTKTINDYGVHYSLPNIAIGILAKFGGIPWKLANKKSNELIVGFNTKQTNEGSDQYLGSAVFFDNEGRLGGVKGLPIGDETALVQHLKSAISDYVQNAGKPDRLIIHYYKPPRKDEVKNILKLLEEMALSIPIAVVEVNDSKAKLDICFDADYNMGMPESGVFVKVGYNEYLLFNNNRYQKSPPRKIDDELPIKLKLNYVNTGGFSAPELIAQVYEFSRLNWKGLKQRSVPVTTTYSKAIADFSSQFNGEIPDNDVANNIPWFI
ncbi:MAG: hypothetical protein H6854_04180 [Rhodospirillales bacterium]|nr:hypothetical protein [Rhodospirillales bacterium]